MTGAAATGTPMTSDEAIALIEAARWPADLFGRDAVSGYRRLARLTHPDTRPGGARAAAAFARLADLWRQYQSGQPGQPGQPGQSGQQTLVARGDIANLYRQPRGLLKIARDPADNDLIRHEATALSLLARSAESHVRAYFPRLIEAQRQLDPRTGARRRANVLPALDGFRSLAQVRAAFPGGVDPRDAAWMWRRLLVAIGAAHRAGVIHGAVLPEHVLIQPAEHGLVLIDWCYSATTPAGQIPAIVSRYRDWYPPEFAAGRRSSLGSAGPDLDIWLATRCLTELTGARRPAQLAAFATGCMLASQRRRPDDAWRLLAELDELLERLYGPRRFRHFAIPA